MDETKVLGLLAAASGVAEAEVTDLVATDEGLATLQTAITSKLKGIKDEADGRALKLVTTAFKQAGVDDAVFEKGREFKVNLAAAVEALNTKAAEKGSETLTPEQALAHPAVKQKLNEITTSIDQRVEAGRQQEREALKTERENFAREKLAGTVSEKAATILDTLQPIFNEKPEKAATQRANLLASIVSGKFIEVNGEIFPADANGEVLKDASMNAVKLSDLVRKQTEALYDLPLSTPKASPAPRQSEVAATPQGDASFKEYKGPAPKNEADVLAIRNDQSLSLAARNEVKAFWEAQGQ